MKLTFRSSKRAILSAMASWSGWLYGHIDDAENTISIPVICAKCGYKSEPVDVIKIGLKVNPDGEIVGLFIPSNAMHCPVCSDGKEWSYFLGTTGLNYKKMPKDQKIGGDHED